MLALKPCCLPVSSLLFPHSRPARALTRERGKQSHGLRRRQVEVGGHVLEAARVTVRGRYIGGEWQGEPRQAMAPKFRSPPLPSLPGRSLSVCRRALLGNGSGCGAGAGCGWRVCWRGWTWGEGGA
eukprot:3934155-Rhodomonas_salina.1